MRSIYSAPLHPRLARVAATIIPFAGLAVLLFLAAALAAQTGVESTHAKGSPLVAELSGTVRKVSKTGISRATISLENLETRERRMTTSMPSGNFLVVVPPGEYRLLVTAPGYKSFTVPKLPLVAGDQARADVHMEAGEVGETVQGASGSVRSRAGAELAGKSVSDLPENQRNFINLVQVSGGANEGSTNNSASSSRPGAQHQSSSVSLGGQPESTNNSTIDGIDNNERINSQIALHPSVDAVDEVQVLANAYPANYGHAGGGVINLMTRSGTDRFHGSLYEYFRNDLFDAYPYQFGAKNPKPKLLQNQFGGSLGGPLRSHKTYLFVDYEGFRLIQGRAPVELTVPTAYEHDHPGDFTDVGGPFLTNLDPAGLAYFKLYPLPNVPGSSDQFVSSTSGSNFSHAGDFRIDDRISPNDQLFGRFSYNQAFVYIPGEFPRVREMGMTIEPGGSLTSFPGNMDDTSVNFVLDYTHSLRKDLRLSLKAGYTFWSEVDSGLNPNTAANRGFGQPGINSASTSNGLAPINVLQASPIGTDGYYRPINQADNVYQSSGTLSWNHGAHNTSFGGSLIRRDWRNIGSGYGLGFWVVNDLPSLLQGQFQQVQRQVDLVNTHYQSWEPSAYAQDDCKIRHNLTLNLGLRYDIFTPPIEARDQLSNFDVNAGKIVLAGENGVSRTAGVQTDYTGIAPRFGFAWNLRGTTALKGGYGIVYFRPLDTFVYKAPPFIDSFGVCSSLTCPVGFNTLAAGLPMVTQTDANRPSGILLGMRAFDYHNSYLQQFNLGVEQKLGDDTVRVLYVGALGRHISRSFPDFNAPPPNTAADPNPLRPFFSTVPKVTQLLYYIDTEGSSNYNALQASFSHSSQRGLTATFNYTLAHGMDNAGKADGGFGTVPALASTLDYGNSNFDVRQRVAAMLFYQLPLGGDSSGVRGVLTKGWQINFAGVWSMGLPFTVLNATDVSNTNPGASGADRPNQIASFAVSNPTVGRFFNTEAFVAQAPGALGSERRNQLYGPHNRRVDASLFKTFPFAKEANLQFRVEIFNLTNTPNFAAPAAILGGAHFGQLTQMTAGYTPREMQLAVRFEF